ncbi:uncharacterized protein LOC131317066 [Rhododendron vialii]|uniref:uncharacterized protein LOC131317066 n=1 Tax=Rhododendron vialii TaxID=182163 RepID=UPI00265FAD4D|nr:uncharacterized protein LOC131317066 [Rhododendron vialii]
MAHFARWYGGYANQFDCPVSLPIFYGLASENHFSHIHDLEKAFDRDEVALLHVFSASLRDSSLDWFNLLSPRLTWGEIVIQFFNHFNPSYETHMLLQELSDFSQHDDESLSLCWERFKFVVFSWSSFNCELGSLLVIFCRGLNLKPCEVDFRSTDEFLDKTPEDAWDFLDELTQKLQFCELTKNSEDTNSDGREKEEKEPLPEDTNSEVRVKEEIEPLPEDTNSDGREEEEIEPLVISEGYMPFEELLPIVALNNQVLSALDCATPFTESPLSQEFLNVELIDFFGVDKFNLVYHPYLVDFVNALKIDLVWAIHLVVFKCLKRIRQMCYSKYLILWHGRVQFLIKCVEWSTMFIVLALVGMINVRNPRLATLELLGNRCNLQLLCVSCKVPSSAYASLLLLCVVQQGFNIEYHWCFVGLADHSLKVLTVMAVFMLYKVSSSCLLLSSTGCLLLFCFATTTASWLLLAVAIMAANCCCIRALLAAVSRLHKTIQAACIILQFQPVNFQVAKSLCEIQTFLLIPFATSLALYLAALSSE